MDFSRRIEANQEWKGQNKEIMEVTQTVDGTRNKQVTHNCQMSEERLSKQIFELKLGKRWYNPQTADKMAQVKRRDL